MGKIVEAVGRATVRLKGATTNQVAGGAGAPTPNAPTSAQIEAAMAHAAKDAMVKGITDPDEIRAMMLAARERAKQPPQE